MLRYLAMLVKQHGIVRSEETLSQRRFAHCANPCLSTQVTAVVDRTYHDTNHSVLLAGDPLPVHLRRSRAVKAAR